MKIRDNGLLRSFLLIVAIIGSSYILGRFALNPGMTRLLLFTVFFLIAMSLSLRNPIFVLYSLLLYLPLMGFFRRLLIPYAGWSGFDPLVVLAPSVVLLLGSYWVYKTYVGREPIEADTRIFKLLRILLLLSFLQVFNPLQGSLMVGLGGMIFYIVPLTWMLMGRLYVNERWIKRIFATIVVMGVISLLYSLKQVHLGFFSFEEAWIEISGYAALMVGQNSRGFSFFTSAAEYAQYILLGGVICWVALLKAKAQWKVVAALLLPLFSYALMMTGSRTPVIMFILALAIITVVNARTNKTRILITGLVAVAVIIAYQYIINIDAGENELIARQVNGLANPMDEEHSTLGLHWEYFSSGMRNGLTNPIGSGLGSTTLAGMKFSDGSSNSEVDISNMFTSTGLFGGILYMMIVFHVMRLAYRHCRHNSVNLCVFGILLATLGTWLIGGNYTTVAIVWLCIGYLDRQSARESSAAREEG